jgi:riboflavin kinase / FMN adenylyltransferase
MRIVRSANIHESHMQGAVLALGNFDGFHRGHQAVLARAAALAKKCAAPLGILTFDPHPARYFTPLAPPFALTSLAQKLALFVQAQVEQTVLLDFDASLAATSAEQFLQEVLLDALKIRGAVAGYDFTFGKARGGTTKTLLDYSVQHNFAVEIVAPEGDSQPISSTRIRACLLAGDPEGAAQLLGRWWQVEALVQKGDQRGRTLGFPTANMALGDYLRPKFGVYAVRVWHEQQPYDAVANLGLRPTIGNTPEALLEVHLLNYAGDLYHQTLKVDFLSFLRPEMKFDNLAALKSQISADRDAASHLLRQTAYRL